MVHTVLAVWWCGGTHSAGGVVVDTSLAVCSQMIYNYHTTPMQIYSLGSTGNRYICCPVGPLH